MIIENGYIKIIETTGGGFQDGDPMPVVETLSDPISCNFKANNNDRKGVYIDGEFKRCSFEILIENQPFKADRIHLYNLHGDDFGEFRVQDYQYYDFVDAVKISV